MIAAPRQPMPPPAVALPGEAAARAWVRLYTSGMRPDLRDERRAELASDLWEQRRSERSAAGLAILLRMAPGIPADIAWRLEHATMPTWLREPALALFARLHASASWSVRRGLPGVTFLLAGGYVLVGLVVLIVMAAGGGDKPVSEQAWGGALLITFGSLIAAGFYLASSRPRLAIGLVLAGTVPFGLAFHATIVIPAASVLALAAACLKVRRRRLTQ